MKKLILSSLALLGLNSFAFGQANTTIQWQTPNPGFDMAIEDPFGVLVPVGSNWLVQIYIDLPGTTNMNVNLALNPVTQNGTDMNPFFADNPSLNPTGDDLPVGGTDKQLVSLFAPGSFFELLSPSGDAPFNYDLVEGQSVYTVVFNASTIGAATAWGILDDMATMLPNQPPLPNPELPTVIYIPGDLPAADWVYVVPEPSTYAMVLMGMFLVVIRRSRIRNNV